MIAITEKNFKCNEVKKKKGEEITKEEIEKMGEFAHIFSQDGLILIVDEKVKKEVEKSFNEKKKINDQKKADVSKKMQEIARIKKAQNEKK